MWDLSRILQTVGNRKKLILQQRPVKDAGPFAGVTTKCKKLCTVPIAGLVQSFLPIYYPESGSSE